MAFDQMHCRICGALSGAVFRATLLKKHSVAYYLCGVCRFLQTEEPFWLEEAYAASINTTDTGIMARNLWVMRKASVVLYSFFDRNARFLDFAGGYGILVRMMRDIGFDFFWQDLYTPNQVARGFELKPGAGPFELVTSIESFEHFVKPLEEIEKMLAYSRNILFSTELLPSPVPKPEEWWYFGLEHGQHISFYSRGALEHIAKRHGLRFLTAGGIHHFTEKPISPRLYKAALKLGRLGYFNWIARRMESRTEKDMHALKADAR
jgi:hypothetical protein